MEKLKTIIAWIIGIILALVFGAADILFYIIGG